MSRNGCKGCEERHPNCHSDCERYKAFKEQIQKGKDAERLVKLVDGVHAVAVERVKKKYGKK